MRTAKYHDFGALKVLFLFIILVILGLFVYNQFIKPAFFHTAPDDAWVIEEADCENDGVKYKICTDCGKEFDHEVIPALGHKAGDEIVTKEPTCTDEGTGHIDCKNCGEVLENVTHPALGHTESAKVVENQKEHTSTQGASYENVIYCSVCNEELDREKVDVPHETIVKIIPEVEPTCHTEGSGYVAIFCNTCDKFIEIASETSSIDTAPHDYAWSVIYSNGQFKISSATCTVEECGHVYDPTLDEGYSLAPTYNKEASIKPTCVAGLDVYNVDILHLGKKVAETVVTVEVPATEHHHIVTENGIIDITELVHYDATGRPYYNYSTGLFSLVYQRLEGQTISEAMAAAWDENGFATGTFKCPKCGQHVAVTIYNDKA